MLQLKFVLLILVLLALSLHAIANEIDRPASDVRSTVTEIKLIQNEFDRIPASLHDLIWVSSKIKMLKQIVDILDEAQTIPAKQRYSEPEDIEFTVRMKEAQQAIDKAIYFDLTNLMQVHKWFRIDLFGTETDQNAVVIIRHLDDFADFQVTMLTDLQSRYTLGESQGLGVAQLADHMALKGDGENFRHLQKFGTEGLCVEKNNWLPFPVEDESCLDLRRSRLGLPPEKDWILEMSSKCS